MNETRVDRNLRTVQRIYDAFARGEIGAIVASCTDGCTFSTNVARSPVPWHRTFRGQRALPDFFRLLAEHLTITTSETHTWIANGCDVAVKVRLEGVVRRNDRPFEEEQIHWWTLDDTARVVRLCLYSDTLQIAEAWEAEARVPATAK